MSRPVRTLLMLALAPVLLLCHTSQLAACSLNPTANITNSPSGSIFYAHTETEIELSGSTSVANCGTITEYRWRIDGVTVSWSMVYNHIFSILPSQDQKLYSVELRVRNSSGNYHTRTKTIAIRRVKSLYYLTDHLGSVRVTVNEAGDPVGWDDYYPFGMQMPGRTLNASNPHDDTKFTGYELEQQGDLGLYHAGARMYDPEIGRFLSVDPIVYQSDPRDLFEIHNGMHLHYSPYAYTFNNPLIYTDPDGRNPTALRLGARTLLSAERYAKLTATTKQVVIAGVAIVVGQELAENFYDFMTTPIEELISPSTEDVPRTTDGTPLSELNAITMQEDPSSAFQQLIQNPQNHNKGKPTGGGGEGKSKFARIIVRLTAGSTFFERTTRELQEAQRQSDEQKRLREERERKRAAEEAIRNGH